MPDKATVEAEHGTVEVGTSGDNAAMIAQRAKAIIEQIARSDQWRVEIDDDNDDGE